MHEGKAKGSQLIIFPDGTLYHIDLKRADIIPPNLFVMGAAGRVDEFEKHFDAKPFCFCFSHQNKSRPEFRVVAGEYKGIPMAALSCGIGIGPSDIIANELHALFEYFHETDQWSKEPAKVNVIRIGTAGTSQPDIPVGSFAISRYALGLDNLGVFYPSLVERRDSIADAIERKFRSTTVVGRINPLAYSAAATPLVVKTLESVAAKFGERAPMVISGITLASPGFFGPEGRSIGRIRTALSRQQFLDSVTPFEVAGERIVNFEMETSVLFRINHEILGYNVGAICTVLDNLSADQMIGKKAADERMEQCIKIGLESMAILAKS
jgi:uridine phosphorylase